MVTHKASAEQFVPSSDRVRVLAIETSCDETAISTLSVSAAGERVRVLTHLVSSQVPIHQRYGGVVPEVAARSHVPETISLLTQALGKKGMDAFDAIAVTRGPGLATALGVGVEAARMLAFLSNKPLIGVNHLEGHIASAWLNQKNRRSWNYPLLALIVSGGHTELVQILSPGEYKIIGQTRDDAAGEAFDKTAKLMGLQYPGGPQIAKLARSGNKKKYPLPRPMLQDPGLDMSFSGLKTAVRNTWHEIQATVPVGGLLDQARADLAACVQQAIIDVLIEKTRRALHQTGARGVLLVGGVSANKELRAQLGRALRRESGAIAFLPSDRRYITDNAAMIAAAGYWHLLRNDVHPWETMELEPELSLS
ncbi:tRNA (adenosine(37)-N6)-threonylcarbamoyltransferase complex transferase subunit TsaD [Patescibacteria group bacterium]|nr:tRNA (adenosine(37)-N6)-threonylcarbamoyltransferase complex transferase subunit TsaD [Patescibacteria group bacterium]